MNTFTAFNEKQQPVEIGYLHLYHKYRLDRFTEEINPNFDAYSGKILDLKEKDPSKRPAQCAAINFFLREIPSVLPQKSKFFFCGVPSSKSGIYNGIYYLIEEYFNHVPTSMAIKANNLIVRQQSLQAAHLGGPRKISDQKKSMTLNKSFNIHNQDVVVIDDVVTTGSTLIACQELLLEGGAKSVTLLALGKTTI